MRLIGEDQNIEFYMRSGHRSYSSYLESVYFGWWVVCIHAHVLGLRDLLYTPRGNKSNSDSVELWKRYDESRSSYYSFTMMYQKHHGAIIHQGYLDIVSLMTCNSKLI